MTAHEYYPYNVKDNAIVANILNQLRDIKSIFILALRNFKEFAFTSICKFFPVKQIFISNSSRVFLRMQTMEQINM